MDGAAVQLSFAEAPSRNAAISGSVAAVPPVAAHSTEIAGGHVTDGGVLSTTCAVTALSVAFAHASAACTPRRTVAGEPVRPETTTLPLTATVWSLFWTTLTAGG